MKKRLKKKLAKKAITPVKPTPVKPTPLKPTPVRSKSGSNRITSGQALKLDPNKLTLKELRKATRSLADVANKRLKRASKKGLSTPATRGAMRSGGKFTTKGKTLNQLRSEFIRAKQFLESKSSTIRGYEETLEKTKKALEKQGVNISTENMEKFFSVYEKLKEIDPSITLKTLKYNTMASIAEKIETGKDVEELILEMQDKIDDIYEGNVDYYDTISDFFEIE